MWRAFPGRGCIGVNCRASGIVVAGRGARCRRRDLLKPAPVGNGSVPASTVQALAWVAYSAGVFLHEARNPSPISAWNSAQRTVARIPVRASLLQAHAEDFRVFTFSEVVAVRGLSGRHCRELVSGISAWNQGASRFRECSIAPSDRFLPCPDRGLSGGHRARSA